MTLTDGMIPLPTVSTLFIQHKLAIPTETIPACVLEMINHALLFLEDYPISLRRPSKLHAPRSICYEWHFPPYWSALALHFHQNKHISSYFPVSYSFIKRAQSALVRRRVTSYIHGDLGEEAAMGLYDQSVKIIGPNEGTPLSRLCPVWISLKKWKTP